jgi:hypothetical protein
MQARKRPAYHRTGRITVDVEGGAPYRQMAAGGGSAPSISDRTNSQKRQLVSRAGLADGGAPKETHTGCH